MSILNYHARLCTVIRYFTYTGGISRVLVMRAHDVVTSGDVKYTENGVESLSK